MRKIKVVKKSYHRNGICGDGFNVYIFEDKEIKKKMLAVDFGEWKFAVFDLAELAKDNIQFGSNSWRGDEYASSVRSAADKLK